MNNATPAITFTLVLDGQEMRICYQPDWISFPELGVRYGQVEFSSPHEPRRRIPVSETGYRSHFAPMAEIEACASPEEYAHEIARTLMRRKGPPLDDGEDEQLALF
jgi:hypothetical protein